MQEEVALNVHLTLGNQTKFVNLKVPLALIIGDAQGGDGICGRSPYYQTTARCICRMCDANALFITHQKLIIVSLW